MNIKQLLKFLMLSGIIWLGSIYFSGSNLMADDTRWIAIGNLHSWYSSAGSEIETGRTSLVADQQDGLRWPAQLRYQDCEAAKAMWIGCTDFNDPNGQVYPYKVVHIGPRVINETTEIMPAEFKMIGRFKLPDVMVDGNSSAKIENFDKPDEFNELLNADRMIYNVDNTQLGVTVERRIYAFSNQYYDNFFIYDYVFKNTGIINKAGAKDGQTLNGVIFHFQYRYAPSREVGPYGFSWLPQSTSWGHNTVLDQLFSLNGNPFRAIFAWHGRHSKAALPTSLGGGVLDNIGGPNVGSSSVEPDGRFGAAQYVGVYTIHADKSASDKSDDIGQPFTTQWIGSDDDISKGNDAYNKAQMAKEYAAMSAGRPAISHADLVGSGFADLYGNTPGGYSNAHGMGPYKLAVGDSIHIVLAEAVAGLSRTQCVDRGRIWLNWKKGIAPSNNLLPSGFAATTADAYKNAWVATGRDSLLQAFQRAAKAFENGLEVPLPPPPPSFFRVTSQGDRIKLEWDSNAEAWPNFNGYRIYRTMGDPSDSLFTLLWQCGAGTENPDIVNVFDDKSPRRGFDYYYYITSYDDGSTNDIEPNKPLESSKFYTMTSDPGTLQRPPGTELSQIRVVPNPYNIRAIDIQFGRQTPDRIMFYNIPPFCRIKIYTESGELVRTLEHTNASGDEAWDCKTTYNQVVVSGVYIAYIEVTEEYREDGTNNLIFRKGENTVVKFVIIR